MALSRAQMEQAINSGGSVWVKTAGGKRLATSIDQLPSPAELAKTDEEKAAAASDLDARIAELQKQRDGLTGETSAVETGDSDEQSKAGEGADRDGKEKPAESDKSKKK